MKESERDLANGEPGKGRTLHVMNEFWIDTPRLTPDVPPLYICPHIDILPTILKFLKNRRESELPGDTGVCAWCTVNLCWDGEIAAFKVTVTRNLGKDAWPWPGEAWDIQSGPRLQPEMARKMYLTCVLWIVFELILAYFML